jgi:hypothetical protein
MSENPYTCEAIIDIGVYIGACMKPATVEHELGYLFCDECASLVEDGCTEVDLPKWPYGRAHQDEIISAFYVSDGDRED